IEHFWQPLRPPYSFARHSRPPTLMHAAERARVEPVRAAVPIAVPRCAVVVLIAAAQQSRVAAPIVVAQRSRAELMAVAPSIAAALSIEAAAIVRVTAQPLSALLRSARPRRRARTTTTTTNADMPRIHPATELIVCARTRAAASCGPRLRAS